MTNEQLWALSAVLFGVVVLALIFLFFVWKDLDDMRRRTVECPHDQIIQRVADPFDHFRPRMPRPDFVCKECQAPVRKPSDSMTLEMTELRHMHDSALAQVRYETNLDMSKLQDSYDAQVSSLEKMVASRDAEIVEQSRTISDLHARVYLDENPV